MNLRCIDWLFASVDRSCLVRNCFLKPLFFSGKRTTLVDLFVIILYLCQHCSIESLIIPRLTETMVFLVKKIPWVMTSSNALMMTSYTVTLQAQTCWNKFCKALVVNGI